MLSPPRRKTAADEAETALFRAIMDGTIPPGAPLRLQDLSDQLAMSMMPIREAIRRLQGLGLVEVIPHKGAWVRPLSVEDLYDTYFTRIHLEAVTLREAATRPMPPELASRARAAFEDRQEAFTRGDLLASRDAHECFHFALYEASGSTWLVHSIWPVWRNSERYRNESMRNPEHRAAREAEHLGMLEALEAGDRAGAVRLIVQHLTTSCHLVAASLDPPENGGPPRSLPTAEEFLV